MSRENEVNGKAVCDGGAQRTRRHFAAEEKVTSLISGVTPAIFASVQKDRTALKGYMRSFTEAKSQYVAKHAS